MPVPYGFVYLDDLRNSDHCNFILFDMKTIITLLAIILLLSCGSKKKVVERSKEQSIEIVNKDVQRSKTNNITTNTVIEQNDLKTTVRPIDESKPSKYNDNEFQNAEIVIEKSEKKQEGSTVDKSVTDLSDQSDYHNDKSSGKVSKDIDIDRSWGVMDWLWLFLAVAIVLLAVRLYVKKINPIAWIKNRLTN